ncbi:MAG: single-stranded-DNA-specific exonuclease RecJ [Lachnospiraceae bacterium]|nr:single-stranded-DNA-specific exonuclease RecJ [Lachnospiraceae bacterium]
MKKWVVTAKRADFDAIGRQFHISPMLARIIRNRDMQTPEEIERFLNGTLADLPDPSSLKGVDMAAALLQGAIEGGGAIRVVGDYDVDGICATYILVTALRDCGAEVSWQIPDRIRDGYGLNRSIVEKAVDDKISLLLTCDNGIAAVSEIAYAKEEGMCVIVTDHHEAPEVLPDADVIIDPKEPGSNYPYPDICGAVVAWKLTQVLCKRMGVPEREEHLQFAAFATVCDVMPLLHENRIIVKYGLEALKHTQNAGLDALLTVTGINRDMLAAYHFGFILGPCVNATGRLDEAERALELFMTEDEHHALLSAQELKRLNEERKNITLAATEQAIAIVQSGDAHNPAMQDDKVLVIYLPDCHESIAGIVAGKVREHYYRPTILLTGTESGQIKGSGRSIEAYNMFAGLQAVSELFVKFGGHKMAAGMSLAGEAEVNKLRTRLNAQATLTEADLTEKLTIDIAMPLRFATETFVEELDRLSPYGTGNPRPVFAQKGLKIRNVRVQGDAHNVVKVDFEDETVVGVLFGDGDAFAETYHAGDTVMVAYTPVINEFRGVRSVEAQIKEIKPDTLVAPA